MNTDGRKRKQALDKRAKALRRHCLADNGLQGDPITGDELSALEPRIAAWFANEGADLGPVERLACISKLFAAQKREQAIDRGRLSDKQRIEYQLRLLGNDAIFAVPASSQQAWPPPLRYRMDGIADVANDDRFQFGHFTSLFDVFLHFHFTVLASQFLWLTETVAAKDPDQPADGLTLLGLKIVHAALIDTACMGGRTWLQRAAGLSCAGQALLEAGHSAPCGELFALLDPDAIDPKPAFDPDPQRRDRPVGALSPRAQALDFWPDFRNKLFGHTDLPSEPMARDYLDGALHLRDLIDAVFGVYHGYRLAYIQVTTLDQCVIQGLWDDRTGKYASAASRAHKETIEADWGPQQDGVWPAPTPPTLLAEPGFWHGSLLLYRKEAPKRDYLYLMPLGYRYQDPNDITPYPGLLDSVTWNSSKYGKQERVLNIAQKLYLNIDAQDTGPKGSISDFRAPPDSIEEIVAYIRCRYDLDLPIPATAAPALPSRFELNHLEQARQLAQDAVPRPDEVANILRLARDAQSRRLLLIGAPGVGKSVLLAQVAADLDRRGEALVYLSMDLPLDPEPEPDAGPGLSLDAGGIRIGDAGGIGIGDAGGIGIGDANGIGAGTPRPSLDNGAPSKTLAVPVRMNLLTTLLRISAVGGQAPTAALAEQPVRQHILGLLGQLDQLGQLGQLEQRDQRGQVDGQRCLWVLIDALDQANGEPAALLSGLPWPLPANLRVIATTRPIDAVIDAVETGSGGAWDQDDIRGIQRGLTQDMLLHTWPPDDRQALTDAPGDPLPAALLEQLHDNSAGLPLLLREWGDELHQRWLEGDHAPTVFADFCRLLAQTDLRTMPLGFKKRLDRSRASFREQFNLAELGDLLLWTLALLDRPLGLDQLLRATTALAAEFPGVDAATPDTLRAALGHFGGFITATGTAMDPRWRLYHSLFGQWFIADHHNPQRLAALREALIPIGAAPDLDDPASLAAWAERIFDGDPAFTDLAAPLRMRLLQRLLEGLPDGPIPLPALKRFGHRRAGLIARQAWELQQRGDKTEASKQADAARRMAERLLADAGAGQRPELMQDLAYAWSTVGIVVWDAKDPARSLAPIEHSLRLRQALREEFPGAWTPSQQRGLATAYDNHCIVLYGLKRYDETLTEVDHAIELYQGLEQDKPEVRQGLANTLHNKGVALAKLERYDEALTEYDHAIELYQGLDQDKPEVRQELGRSHDNRGIALHNLKRYDEALEAYDGAIKLYQGLDLDQPGVRRALGNSYNNRGTTLNSLNRYDEPLEALDRAIELFQGLDLDQPEVRQALGRSHYNRGNTLSSIKRYDEALQAYDRAIELYQGLDLDQQEVRRALGESHYNRGSTLKSLKRYEEALEACDSGIQFSKNSDIKDIDTRTTLALLYMERSSILIDLGRNTNAISAFARGLDLITPKMVLAISKTKNLNIFTTTALFAALLVGKLLPKSLSFFSAILHYLGLIYAKTGNFQRALPYINTAIRLGNKAATNTRLSLCIRPWELRGSTTTIRLPETYTGAPAPNKHKDYYLQPLIGGTWSVLTAETAQPHFSRLTSFLHSTKQTSLLKRVKENIATLRTRELACYPEWLLCEATISNRGHVGVLSFLSSNYGALLLPGSSDPIYAFNQAIDLRLGNQQAYLDYWLLFCSAVRGDEGRFQVIESTDTLTWRADTDPGQIATLVAKLEEPEIQALDADGALITGDVLYNGSIGRARFKVYSQGKVEMLADTVITEEPSLRTERFDGPIREWTDDPVATINDEAGPIR